MKNSWLVLAIAVCTLCSCNSNKNKNTDLIPSTSLPSKTDATATRDVNFDKNQQHFKYHHPCSFSISLPETFKITSTNSESSPDYCDYQVTSDDGVELIQIHSLNSSRFEISEINQLYSNALASLKIDVTYKIQKGNWFVISGINKENGKILYWKKVSGANYISDLRIEYSKNNAFQIESYIGKIAKSFTSQ